MMPGCVWEIRDGLAILHMASGLSVTYDVERLQSVIAVIDQIAKHGLTVTPGGYSADFAQLEFYKRGLEMLEKHIAEREKREA